MDEYTHDDVKFDEPIYSAKQVDTAFVVGATFGFLFGFSIAAYSFNLSSII